MIKIVQITIKFNRLFRFVTLYFSIIDINDAKGPPPGGEDELNTNVETNALFK